MSGSTATVFDASGDALVKAIKDGDTITYETMTGKPIGHGCVRMEGDNARRIAEYSRGRRTSVEIDGRAAPVLCEPARRCGTTGSAEGRPGETRLAEAEVRPVPGLEGEMS